MASILPAVSKKAFHHGSIISHYSLRWLFQRSLGLGNISRPSTVPATKRYQSSAEKPLSHSDGELYVTFLGKDNVESRFTSTAGTSLLEIAQRNGLKVEGACGGECACCTCHMVIKDSQFYDKLSSRGEDEDDMLDTAPNLEERSRLGCQVKMEMRLNGMVVRLPTAALA